MTPRHRVLIVEDEIIIAWDLQAELEAKGYVVAGPAGSPAEALEELSKERIDLAILDINLGAETSYDLARHCVEHRIPVVFLSGENGVSRPDDLSGITLVAKPVDYRSLARAVEKAVSP